MFDGVPPARRYRRPALGGANSRRRIAVVGSGIAGLSAAWFLSRHHDVTVFEANDRFGGHSRTVDVPIGDPSTAVDTGFIVYNELNYPNLTKMFDVLDVATDASNMSFSVSIGDGRFEYAGGLGIGGYVAQPSNMLTLRYWRMLADISRFLSEFKDDDTQHLGNLTLGSLLAAKGYSDWFREHHILPMGAAIWSGTIADLEAFPAMSFIAFFRNHGLLKVRGRPQWRSVHGGSRQYVNRLLDRTDAQFRSNCPVARVTRHSDGIHLHSPAGVDHFDDVVLASHANQSLSMLGDPSVDERRILGGFSYRTNQAFLHCDESLMPKRRAAWAAWNYVSGETIETGAPVGVTYWMNRLQTLETEVPVFVSLNPTRLPVDRATVEQTSFSHPQFDERALEAQRELPDIQGVNRTWFCGSYCGFGFHEDALVSGMRVAQALGADVAWRSVQNDGSAASSSDYLAAAE